MVIMPLLPEVGPQSLLLEGWNFSLERPAQPQPGKKESKKARPEKEDSRNE